MNITYTFPTGTNNGKISSQTDSISGETFRKHQVVLDGLRNRLTNLLKRWDMNNCDPPGGPPGLSDLIDQTSFDNLQRLQEEYQQFIQDMQLILSGTASAAIYGAAYALWTAIEGAIEAIFTDMILIPTGLALAL